MEKMDATFYQLASNLKLTYLTGYLTPVIPWKKLTYLTPVIPWSEFMPTTAVMFFIFNFIVSPIICVGLLCWCLSIYHLFPFALAYICWIYYDLKITRISKRGGRRSQYFRKLNFWKHFSNYFPLSLIKTVTLDPTQNYLMGCHPHGIVAFSAFGNFCTEGTRFSDIFSGITPHLLTMKINFYWPFLRKLCLAIGACDVSKESINWILTKQGVGNAAVIVIGGAEEALEARPGTYNITLKRRKGFVKMAIRTGAQLVPVFSFGENDLFHQADNPKGSYLRAFQDQFKKILGFSPPLFHGRGIFNYSFGLLPFRKPVYTVVGKPIKIEKSPEPSQEMIDKIHQQYMDDLSALFDEYKEGYGIDKDMKLNFV